MFPVLQNPCTVGVKQMFPLIRQKQGKKPLILGHSCAKTACSHAAQHGLETLERVIKYLIMRTSNIPDPFP
jgi:hypothetical protein